MYNGPANPQYFGSIRNDISFKGFSLSINLLFKAGYFFRRTSIVYSSLVNNGLGHTDYSKRWQKPGDENSTTVPSFIYPVNSNRETFYANSEVLVDKGDHIRLQDISFRYDVSKAVWKFLPFDHMQIYIYANNLGILWKANKDNIDPDYQNGYPTPRTISVGIKFNL